MVCIWSLLAVVLLISLSEAFYIPGWSIRSYKPGRQIALLVNKLYSDKTQLQYAYHDVPFVCQPTGRHGLGGQSMALNLGEVLRGDRITVSDMELVMGQDKRCELLCTRELSGDEVARARELIEEGYAVEWVVDNLPGATSFVTSDKTKKYYAAGFKLGYSETTAKTGRQRYLLHNHHTIVIRHGRAPGRAGARGEQVIVGFEVYPKSIGSEVERDGTGCPVNVEHVEGALELRAEANKTRLDESGEAVLSVPYTYSVYFRRDDSMDWAHRWDYYFVNQDQGSRIHWLAIANSLMMCGLMAGIVAIIMTRTIGSDIKGYREVAAQEARARRSRGKGKPAGLLDRGTSDDDDDGDASDGDYEALEEVTGWKLLHGDVFRPPRHGKMLAPLVGSGTQLLFMALGLVLLSAVGVLNPSFRGGFLSVGMGLFIFAGLFSGYFSARVYCSLTMGRDYVRNAVVTGLLFPGLAFGLVLVVNLFVWAQASSTAIPFGTLAGLAALWLCVQMPLVLAGAYHGHVNAGPWQHPAKTKTNPTAAAPPRRIPPQPWYLQTLPSALLAGLLPFAVVLIELLFVLQSVWQDKSGYYYLFGYLCLVLLLLLVAVAEVSVVAVYMQLCAENYAWWWRSVCVGGGSAVWVFGYCVWYFVYKLHVVGFVSGLLFFAYSLMACCVYALLTGTVGFLSAYAFVRRIYGAIKID
ncbi:hypothetical protein CDD81_4214 [Ophiocordyceps australis]|uniref:Transmembrane 9 superfamily member n=1 Tax=Ophiocordyceps australis TaxID=1399860 RepID=A0A2C5YAF5_9HYPO|nr:hypothetical protein CDD81_4214 [Ophiocordyceps australis]